MFDVGFLGTKAPFYMDIVTLFFAFFPFLMAMAIYTAKKKMYELHYKLQMGLFVVTLIVVGLFEVGVRVSGGFYAFMQHSNVNEVFMMIFLFVHIIVAIVSVVLYSILIYGAFREFKLKSTPIIKSHKRFGMIVFFGMSATSLMGVLIYYLLFVL